MSPLHFSLIYDLYCLLCSTRIQERAMRPRIHILVVVLVPFLLSSAYWALQFLILLVEIRAFCEGLAEPYSGNLSYYSDLVYTAALPNVNSLRLCL